MKRPYLFSRALVHINPADREIPKLETEVRCFCCMDTGMTVIRANESFALYGTLVSAEIIPGYDPAIDMPVLCANPDCSVQLSDLAGVIFGGEEFSEACRWLHLNRKVAAQSTDRQNHELRKQSRRPEHETLRRLQVVTEAVGRSMPQAAPELPPAFNEADSEAFEAEGEG